MSEIINNIYKQTTNSIKIGDEVIYSSRFLKSIGCFSGTLPFAVGEVIGNCFGDIIEIKWKNDFCGEVPTKVNKHNLWLKNTKNREPI